MANNSTNKNLPEVIKWTWAEIQTRFCVTPTFIIFPPHKLTHCLLLSTCMCISKEFSESCLKEIKADLQSYTFQPAFFLHIYFAPGTHHMQAMGTHTVLQFLQLLTLVLPPLRRNKGFLLGILISDSHLFLKSYGSDSFSLVSPILRPSLTRSLGLRLQCRPLLLDT